MTSPSGHLLWLNDYRDVMYQMDNLGTKHMVKNGKDAILIQKTAIENKISIKKNSYKA